MAPLKPFKEVIPPLEIVSHDNPLGAVEEAIKTLPFVPTPNAFQPVELATIKLPVDVDIAAISFQSCGMLNVQVGEDEEMVKAV